MTPRFAGCIAAAALALALCAAAAADTPFDLAGPTLEVTVTRGGRTLPIAEVPNLAPGDRLGIKADLPRTEDARYLLVAAFLRGATNPPPAKWFFLCKTWTRRCARRGLAVRVPAEAQQVLLFLAPKTGGDFRTLVGAVRGQPGLFVRASQDLNQAMLDRSRLERYLAAVRELADGDPQKLAKVAPLLGRSLAIEVNPACLRKIPELQAPCLLQDQGSIILNDGHSTSIVEALTSGPASDLAMEASYSPQLRYGYYSPYVASVFDIARILGSFATARYQYIPAIATDAGDRLALTLSAAPSFHNPLSVLVTALPAVERPQRPPLHTVDPQATYCARQPSLMLPVEGAPLVFSTQYAHGMKLELAGEGGLAIALAATADPQRGGFVIDTADLSAARLPSGVLHGRLAGEWGFSKYAGPRFALTGAHSQAWRLDMGADTWLIVGRDNTVRLSAASVSCVDGLTLEDSAGRMLPVEWKRVAPGALQLVLPLKTVQPGALTLLVRQYGAAKPQRVPLQGFAEAAHLERFTLYAGDSAGVLTGTRLDEVASLQFDGLTFSPGPLSTSLGTDSLRMAAADAEAAGALQAGARARAEVSLKDGRVRSLDVVVAAPRPSVALVDSSVALSPASLASHIELASRTEVPRGAVLTFSVRAVRPAAFDRNEQIIVGTADGTLATTLSVANGGLTLASSAVAVAAIDPGKAFGPSAFGPLQFRVVDGEVRGGWQPLATLVRLPQLASLVCPATPQLACKLSGRDLFLISALAADPAFREAVSVPDGFPGSALPVPHPSGGALYLKLRDDPETVDRASVAVELLPPSRQEVARAAARRAAAQPMTGALVVPPESPFPADLFLGRPPVRRPVPAPGAAAPPGAGARPGG